MRSLTSPVGKAVVVGNFDCPGNCSIDLLLSGTLAAGDLNLLRNWFEITVSRLRDRDRSFTVLFSFYLTIAFNGNYLGVAALKCKFVT